MMAACLMLFAVLAAYGACACLALAMPDHWQSAGGSLEDHGARRQHLRLSGASLLGIALALCLWRDGASFGLMLWAFLMPASGIAVALTLTWYPTRLGFLVRRQREDATAGIAGSISLVDSSSPDRNAAVRSASAG